MVRIPAASLRVIAEAVVGLEATTTVTVPVEVAALLVTSTLPTVGALAEQAVWQVISLPEAPEAAPAVLK